MPIQALLAMLVLWGKGPRVASAQGVEAGKGCRKGWHPMAGMPRAGKRWGCSQVCLRWGMGLAQAEPL